jgi:hypothetical protein
LTKDQQEDVINRTFHTSWSFIKFLL